MAAPSPLTLPLPSTPVTVEPPSARQALHSFTFSPKCQSATCNSTVLFLLKRSAATAEGEAAQVRCEFFIWADIFHLIKENIRRRDNAIRKTWDDILLHEYEVQKMEDKLREREREREMFTRKIKNYCVCTGL